MSDTELKLEKKKKSKKPKKTLDLDDPSPTPDQVADDVANLDLGEKKKKKKKKAEKETADGDDSPRLEKKEKKSKKKEKREGSAEKNNDGEEDDEDGAAPTLDLTKSKKEAKKEKKDKKEKKGKKKREATVMVEGRENQMLGKVESAADYGIENLLDRVFKIMARQGVGRQGSGEARGCNITPPIMKRQGTKKVSYENFMEHANFLKRDSKPFMTYILNEMGTTGNPTDKGGLLIRGKFSASQMEKILRGYIKEYVLCKTCKTPDTTLTKIDRLTYMDCEKCSSRSTVQQTKQGFTALTGKRKKIKEQQGGAALLAQMKQGQPLPSITMACHGTTKTSNRIRRNETGSISGMLRRADGQHVSLDWLDYRS